MTPKGSPAASTRTKPGSSHAFPLNLPQNPADYLDILRFRWKWVVVGVVLGSVASQVVLRFVPKQYLSRTVILAESDQIPKNFIPQLTTDEARDRLRTINEEILARPRVERILEELNPYPELVDVPRADIVDMIRSKAGVGLKGKDAFVVEYTDTSPERAQKMATRLASLFIEETSGNRARQVQGANEFIDSQLAQTKSDMEKVESSLKEIKQRYMGMLPNQLEANLSTLQRLEMQRQSIEEQIRSTKERKGLIERQLALQSQMSEPEAQLVPEGPLGAQSAAPASAEETSLAQLKAHLTELLSRYTDAHPEVVATRAKIARLEKEVEQARTKAAESSTAPAATDGAAAPAAGTESGTGTPAASTSASASVPPKLDHATFLVSELQAQVASVTRDLATLESRLTDTQNEIARYQGRVEKIPEVEQNLQSLERDYGLISKYYSDLLNRKLEAETAGAVERKWKEDQFRILDPAQVPLSPEYPKPSLFLLIGTLAGIGVGLALAFLLEVTDPAIKNMRELESLLPYPVLLTLPMVKAKGKFLRKRRSEPIPPAPAPASTSDLASPKARQDMSA